MLSCKCRLQIQLADSSTIIFRKLDNIESCDHLCCFIIVWAVWIDINSALILMSHEWALSSIEKEFSQWKVLHQQSSKVPILQTLTRGKVGPEGQNSESLKTESTICIVITIVCTRTLIIKWDILFFAFSCIFLHMHSLTWRFLYVRIVYTTNTTMYSCSCNMYSLSLTAALDQLMVVY